MIFSCFQALSRGGKTGLGEAENRGGGREEGLSRPRRGSKLMDERWLTGAGRQLGEAIADSRILARVRAGIYMCAAGRDLVPSRFLSITTRTMGAWLTG